MPTEAIWPGFGELPVAKKVREERRDGENIYFPFLSLQVQFTHQPLNNLRKRFPMITKNGFILLNKFFAYDPKRRVTAEDACKHEYFEVRQKLQEILTSKATLFCILDSL